MIELMKPKMTFAQSEIQDGDVICFQVDITEKEYASIALIIHQGWPIVLRIQDLDGQNLYSNPTQFYDFLQHRVLIFFRPKGLEPDHDHPEFQLVLSRKQNYDVVCLFLELDCLGANLSLQ